MFVQVIEGRVTDAEKARAMMKQMEDQLPKDSK